VARTGDQKKKIAAPYRLLAITTLAVVAIAGCGSSSSSSAPSSGSSTALPGTGKPPIVMGAKSFTEANGNPAWLLHPAASKWAAFSAVCTHQGCPVQWVGGGFQCPCHGATYDANGQVTGGPAPAPLPAIPISVADGQVRTNK